MDAVNLTEEGSGEENSRWKLGGDAASLRRVGSDELVIHEENHGQYSPGGTLREARSSPGIAGLDGPMPDTPSKISSRASLSIHSGSSSQLPTSSTAGRISTHIKNFLSPTYQSREAEFRRLFPSVPNDEKFVLDYSCAFQREILVHGRLYLTQGSVCFYANIFKWETSFVLSFKDIGAVSKERTAKVIPNAIQAVTTEGEKYFFTSFASRDKSYMALFKLWQAALLDEPLEPSGLWKEVSCSYEETRPHSNSDEDDEDSGPCLSVSGKTGAPDSEFPKSGKAEGGGGGLVSEGLSSESEEPVGERLCGCREHEGSEYINRVYPLSVDQIFLLLFTDSPFFHEFQDYRNAEENRLQEWTTEAGTGKKVREVRFKLSLNHSMGPKSCDVFERQTYEEGRSGVYTVRCEATQAGIPYADSFVILSTYCLTRVSENAARIRAHGCPLFKKSLWSIVRSFIEKNTAVGIQEHFDDLNTCLRRECARLGLPSGVEVKEGEKEPERPKGPKKGERAHHLTGASVDLEEGPPVPAPLSPATILSAIATPATIAKSCVFLILLLLLCNALLYWRLMSGSAAGQASPEQRWEGLLSTTLQSLGDMEAELASLKQQVQSVREAFQALHPHSTSTTSNPSPISSNAEL